MLNIKPVYLMGGLDIAPYWSSFCGCRESSKGVSGGCIH